MNVVQMTLAFLFRFFWLTLAGSWAVVAAGQSLVAKEIKPFDPTVFENELKQVQVFTIDSRQLLKRAQQSTPFQLQFGESQTWQITLTPDPITASDYEMTLATEKGLQHPIFNTVQTFRGSVQGAESGTCYLTLAEHFIYGVFEFENQTYFLEPARRFNQNLGTDGYLWYESKDILPNPNGRCAGAILMEKQQELHGLEKSAAACHTVEIAIAADHEMVQLFGNDAALVEKYVLAILHSVRANYDDEFDHQIRFELVKLWISTCATCDPWGEDTNYENLLANFRDWGNSNGFNRTFDVATLWTGRVLDDNIGGGGYYGVLCGRLRYHILRRYSENAGLMRALQAHELGHNLNARHDSTNAPTIMAPLIRDVTTWSPGSKVSINNYFNTALSLPNCISPCTESPLTTDFFVLKSKGCAPLTVQFYNTSSASATQWEWTFAGGNPATSTAANPLVTYTQPGVYSVTLKSGSATTTKTAFVEVKAPPVPNFTIHYQTGQITATFTTNTIADSLRWHWGNGSTSRQASVTHDFQTDGAYPIALIAYNECGADTLTQTLNVVTPPQAGFSAANVVGCAPLTVRFNNESSANAVEFDWQFTGGTPGVSKEKNPTVVYAQPGVYGVTLVARNAAGEVTRRQSNLVQVNTVPSAGFSSRVEGNRVYFRNLSNNGTTLQWRFGDGNTATDQHPEHRYKQSGVYTIELIARNDCGADTIRKTVEIFITTALEKVTWLNEFQLYPNPNDGRFWLSLQGKPQGALQVRIFNVLGQEVHRQEVDFLSGKILQTFDFQNVVNGIYWLEIGGDGGRVAKPFVVQR
jgi:PKD repeat protein